MRRVWRRGEEQRGTRTVPEETPLAFSYQGAAYAVLMATPADLDDFAYGFSLTDGLIETADDILSIESAFVPDGIVLRVTLATVPAAAFWKRRRHIAGPSGCGLCGIESLGEAIRKPPIVSSTLTLSAQEILAATTELSRRQQLNRQTHGVHAAGFWMPGQGLVAVREDVGRHNALDKLVGACALKNLNGNEGAVLLTSRVSLEMVQKTAVLGAGIIVAVSVPTALALRTADDAGITLVAIARDDGFEVFTHPHRITT